VSHKGADFRVVPGAKPSPRLEDIADERWEQAGVAHGMTPSRVTVSHLMMYIEAEISQFYL
jgi:hypothetical protein